MLVVSRSWVLVSVVCFAGALSGCPGTMGTGDGSDEDGGPGRDAPAMGMDGGRDGGGMGTDGGGTGDDGGGTGTDVGSSDTNGRVTCGPTVCELGMVCCNESCGICTPPGGSCIDLACIDAGGGTADGGGVMTRSCGGFVGDALCTRSEYCEHETLDCGSPGVCTTRPEVCTREFAPVCGCDGMTYDNLCLANAAGTDLVARGPCSTGTSCSAQNARGEGPCDLSFGYAWNGSSCVNISGCSCVGADCDSLAPDLAACMDAHRGCAVAGTFACGTDLTCRTGAEYCEQFSGGPIGVVRYTCNPLPDRCRSAPTCATCFPSPGPGGGTCREAGAGEIYVSIAAP